MQYNMDYRIILANIEEHSVNEQSEVIFDGIFCRKLAVLICIIFTIVLVSSSR